jgi:peptidoglycan/LPS O-acetylase OafA/YrhL
MYFAFIDCLRFLAAFSVMMCHYFGTAFSDSVSRGSYFFRYGFLGVELFFIISGFVIFFSLKKGMKEYFIGRATRLLPLFWFVCTAVYVLTYVFKNGNPLPLHDYFRNMLVISNGAVAHMIDSVYWTLTIEIVFYIGIGLFVALFSVRSLEYFYAIWLLISFCTFFFSFESTFLAKLLLVRYSGYFIFGGVLGLLYEEWKTMLLLARIRRIGLLFISSLLPFYASYSMITHDSYGTNNFGVMDKHSVFFVIGIFISVVLAVYSSGFIIQYKKLISTSRFLGGLTYPLYLVHQKLGLMVLAVFGVINKVTFIGSGVVVGMLLISFFLYRIDERVRRKLYNKLLQISFK